MNSGASSSSSVSGSPLAKALRKRRASALFSSSDDTGASSSLFLADPFHYRVDTTSMMPAGGIRHIGWRLIHPSAYTRTGIKMPASHYAASPQDADTGARVAGVTTPGLLEEFWATRPRCV